MERRKFIKYSSFASLGVGLFPYTTINELGKQGASQLVQFSAINTQIRHGALNLPFAKILKSELPFDWLMDVHQNIFLKDGFQRNEAEDMNVVSIALRDKDRFEALQVNNQVDQVSLFWRDQFLEVDTSKRFQSLNLSDENYLFHFACLEEDEILEFNTEKGSSYFVQVLKGQVVNTSKALTNKNGLGLISNTNAAQHFSAKVKSRFLIISRQ